MPESAPQIEIANPDAELTAAAIEAIARLLVDAAIREGEQQ